MGRPKKTGQISDKAIRLRPWTYSKLNQFLIGDIDMTIDDCLTRILTLYEYSLKRRGEIMLHKSVPVKCFDPKCTVGYGHYLFISGCKGSYVTYVCEHQKQFSNIVGGLGEFWSDELLLRAHELRESGHDYARITSELNKEFGTSFEGTQRKDGKGFRGAVSRKFARLAKCNWEETDDVQTLISKAKFALETNKDRKNSEQLGSTIDTNGVISHAPTQ